MNAKCVRLGTACNNFKSAIPGAHLLVVDGVTIIISLSH